MADPGTPIDLSLVPFPVAYPLHFARESMGVTERCDNAVFACDQAMRLTALLLLADYVNPDEDDVDATLSTHIRGLVLPHWQDWTHLADALAAFWTDPARIGRAMFPELAKAWRQVSRPKTRGGSPPPRDAALDAMAAGFPGGGGKGSAGCANEAIWEYRNEGGHRTGTATPDSLPERAARLPALLALTEAIVARLFGDAHFTLMRAVRAPACRCR